MVLKIIEIIILLVILIKAFHITITGTMPKLLNDVKNPNIAKSFKRKSYIGIFLNIFVLLFLTVLIFHIIFSGILII